VLADRLIHHSMVSGILQSGARLIRYRHNDIGHLESLLAQHASENRVLFVATESVFSMDGDYPDLQAIAALKQRFPFCLIVDEAHGTGWYGPHGAGLAAEAGITDAIDIFVGTLGKSLGSQGAYTLFHDPALREYLINEAGEFIFSTYLSPIAAAAASEAINRCRELAPEQPIWRKTAENLRENLRREGWEVPKGDSPILPIHLGDAHRTTGFAQRLRETGILVGAVRPPTVPAGTSRLRISLQRTFGEREESRLLRALSAIRAEFPA
jgi:8-amino-7-oxononanoate synthase